MLPPQWTLKLGRKAAGFYAIVTCACAIACDRAALARGGDREVGSALVIAAPFVLYEF